MTSGVIPIETEGKRIDWNAVRADYIAGGQSYRSLAEKYDISKDSIARKAKAGKWETERDKVSDRAATKIIQKTADAVADNAVIAERVKKRLLLRLERIEQKYPLDATEVRTKQGNSMAIYRIRDLTGAYKDLTDDMQTGSDAANELLQSLIALERGRA